MGNTGRYLPWLLYPKVIRFTGPRVVRRLRSITAHPHHPASPAELLAEIVRQDDPMSFACEIASQLTVE